MHVHYRLAPVELLHHRHVRGIAEPGIAIAGHEVGAVGPQRIEGVLDLLERRFDIRERQRGEQPEAGRMLLHQLGAVLVALTGNPACHLGVAKPQPGIGDRDHRGRDAALVHVLDRLGGRPVHVGGLQKLTPLHLGDPLRRRKMVVHVDAVGLGRACLLRRGRRKRAVTSEPGESDRGQAATNERTTIEPGGLCAIVGAGAVVQQWATPAHRPSSLKIWRLRLAPQN